jgi:hypothetical protein
VAGCSEHGDEPAGSGATELVIDYLKYRQKVYIFFRHDFSPTWK